MIGYHVYADDTQLYISFKCKQPLDAISKVNSCLSDIRRWMITNKLKINDSKTEFIVFRSPLLRCGLSVNVGESQITQSLNVIDLGVTFAQFLNFGDHSTVISRNTYFHIISLLCPAAKVLVSLIMPNINKYLQPAPDQHGFRPDHSTTSGLLQLTTDIAMEFNQRKPTDQTISAAFVTVCHNNLLLKITAPSGHNGYPAI